MGNAGRVLMIPKGEYNSATTYQMLDFVYYQGRSYVCKQTSTGNAPTNTTYWQALTGDASAEIQALTNEVRGNWATGGVNLFNPSEAVVGYVRDNDGTITQLSGYNSTGFIPVTAGSSYTITSLQTGAKWGAWYNSSKQYISGIIGYDNLVAPSNAAYVRLTINNNNDNPNWATTTQIEEGSAATPYQPYAKTNVELTNDVEQLNVTISDASSERDFFEKLITKLHNDVTVTQKVYLGYALYLNNNSYSFEFIKLTDTLSRLEAYQSSRLIVAQNNNGTLLVKTVILTDMT